ncbi:MAG: peptidoglycan DD-metalloendopeptidase family protein, partial [Lachnospiraceae bacterium]
AEELLQAARRELVSESSELVFIDVDMNIEGQAVLWGKIDDTEEIRQRMTDVLAANIKETTQRSYVMKVNNYMVNLGSREEIIELLQTAVDQYDTEDKYQVELVHADGREFNVLTAQIKDTSVQKTEEEAQEGSCPQVKGGIDGAMEAMFADVEPAKEKDFEDYELGLISMNFAEEVEIVEAYLDTAQLATVEQAIEEVIKEQEVNSVYEVVSGDTLSEIAIKVNIPMDQIVAMNDALEDENSTIRVGQELIITVPEPELSVDRQEEMYYEEIYDADIIYIDNDDWYTTQTKTLQEPSAGFRKVVAIVSYRNNTEIGREILKEEVLMEAVPKIVERGTKIPPTYIKPISGGRLTSGFGKRTAPTKGASTYHKGVDWAVPTGTTVVASCGGTVVKAGWGSGYGYVVYINHEDGKQTRYGHLSKVLVSVGQTVSQGQKIALSGNTGVSTGPHLHFEILVNGTQVNPLPYLNK